MKRLMQRIFENKPMPQGLSKEEFHTFMDGAIHDFEESGYLETNKLTPLDTDDDLLKAVEGGGDDLVVVKFWKRKCLACLGLAEMYKDAEGHYGTQAKSGGAGGENQPSNVQFFSVNTKDQCTKELCDRQLIDRTPTVQLFRCGKQVGPEIQSQQLEDFLKEVEEYRFPTHCGA